MPRAPRTRRAADPSAADDPTTAIQTADQDGGAGQIMDTAVGVSGAASASEQAEATPAPRARAPRRRSPRAAIAAVAADAPDATVSADATAELRVPPVAMLESNAEEAAFVSDAAEGAEGETAPPGALRRRPRGGRGRGRGAAARSEAALGESVENDAINEASPSPEDRGAVQASSAAALSPPPAVTPSLSSWSSGRPFIIDENGKVRYTDIPAAADPAPMAATLITEPAAPLEDKATAIDAAFLSTEHGEEPASAEAALDRPDSPIAERSSGASAPAGFRARGRGRSIDREEIERAQAEDRAQRMADDSPDDDSIEGESLIVGIAAEDDAIVESALATEGALDEGDGLGELEGDGIDADGLPRRRRRSRRGGRGRSRNGVASSGLDLEGAPIEAVFTESVLAEPFLPPEPSYEAQDELDTFAPPVARLGPASRPAPAGNLSPLEALIARQNVILDQLTQRQTTMARSMEQALLTIEKRLLGTDLSRVSSMPRIAVFVDVPNIVYAAERYNVNVDFGKLLDFIAHDRTLIRASAYSPISDDPTQRLEFQRFVQPFVNHGYRIVTKPLKRFGDGSIKANFDIELAMDILTMSERLDIVSLVSGDGDFHRLVELVASKGVRVEVVAFAQSTAAELKAIADDYVDLTMHLKDLCTPMEYEPRPRPRGPKIEIG